MTHQPGIRALLPGVVLVLGQPVGGQDKELCSQHEAEVTTSHDRLGRKVEEYCRASLRVLTTHDDQGRVIRRETQFRGGRKEVSHYLLNAEGSTVGYALDLTEEQFDSVLGRLGLAQGADPQWELTGQPNGWLESFPWGTVAHETEPSWERVSADLVGRKIRATFTKRRGGTVRLADDQGEVRTDVRGRFPAYRRNHGVEAYEGTLRSEDQVGLLAEVLADTDGNPQEIRFGETLLLRFSYSVEEVRNAQDLGEVLEAVRAVLIDRRSGETVLDSRLVPAGSGWPIVNFGTGGMGNVELWADGTLFAKVEMPSGVYALLPFEGGEVWRRVQVGGTDIDPFRPQVDYTDDRLRITLYHLPTVVVEAPRSSDSGDPVELIYPLGVELPLTDENTPSLE